MSLILCISVFIVIGLLNLLVAHLCEKYKIISNWFFVFNDYDTRFINGYNTIFFLVCMWPITLYFPVLFNIFEWYRETRCKKS